MQDSGPPGEPDTTSEALSRETVYGVLAEPRRRYVVSVLPDRGESIELADLARAVADREADENDRPVPADHSRRVEISLYHAHLPRLADAGLIEFDRDRNTVVATGTADQLDRFL